MFVDLGAARLTVAAEKGEEKIAIEIQSFVNYSAVRDLHQAVGQYVVYRVLLGEIEPERTLYLAVPTHVFDTILGENIGQLLISKLQMRVIVFDANKEEITKWIN